MVLKWVSRPVYELCIYTSKENSNLLSVQYTMVFEEYINSSLSLISNTKP